MVSSAFTSFSNVPARPVSTFTVWYLLLLHHSQTSASHMIPIHGVWYLLLLHHSQTSVSGVRSRSSVWYLLLLHHSQTTDSIIVQHIQVCTFCFYIILKPDRLTCCTPAGLVSSAFTSFSNLRQQPS